RPGASGGCAIAGPESAGGPRAVGLEPHPAVRPTVFVPAERGLTAQARAALPPTVPHGDAAHTAGRAALLVHALTADPSLLYPATGDWLHQSYRAAGMPATTALVASLREAGVAAVVSGAGPSVLAPAADEPSMRDTPGWLRLSPPVDVAGAVCEVLSKQR